MATANLKKEFPQGITKCGSDGLRFAFFKHKLFAADVHIDINRSSTEGLRFCNKLWNLVKYTQTVLANAPSERLRVSAENVEVWLVHDCRWDDEMQNLTFMLIVFTPIFVISTFSDNIFIFKENI